MKISILFLFSALLVSAAQAQVDKPKVHSMSFADEFVNGATTKPGIELILQSKQRNFSRMIKLRTNFKPELYRASESLATKR